MVAINEQKNHSNEKSENFGLLETLFKTIESNCQCPRCKARRWEKGDKPIIGLRFEKGGDAPEIVFLPEHSSKVKKIIGLKRRLEEHTSDISLWRRILLRGKNSEKAQEQLSESSIILSAKTIEKILDKLYNDGKSKQNFIEISEQMLSLQGFCSLMSGRTTFDNKILQQEIQEFVELVTGKKLSEKIEKEIAEVTTQLPPELRNVKKSLEIVIPLAEFQEMISKRK